MKEEVTKKEYENAIQLILNGDKDLKSIFEKCFQRGKECQSKK